MRLVEDPAKPVATLQLGQAAEVRVVAVHAEEAFGHDKNRPGWRLRREPPLELVEAPVPVALHARARAKHAGDDAVVDETVRQDEVAGARQRAEHRGVGRIAAAPEESAGQAVPGGERPDEALVRLAPAGDQRRGGSGGAMARGRGGDGRDHGGIARQVEVVVVRQVEFARGGCRHPQAAQEIFSRALRQAGPVAAEPGRAGLRGDGDVRSAPRGGIRLPVDEGIQAGEQPGRVRRSFRAKSLLGPDRHPRRAQPLAIRPRHGRVDRTGRVEPDARGTPGVARPGVGEPALVDRAETVGHDDHDRVGADRRRKIGPVAAGTVHRGRDPARALADPPVAVRQSLQGREQRLHGQLGAAGGGRGGRRQRQRKGKKREGADLPPRQAGGARRIALPRRHPLRAGLHDLDDLRAPSAGRAQPGQGADHTGLADAGVRTGDQEGFQGGPPLTPRRPPAPAPRADASPGAPAGAGRPSVPDWAS
jgi:hypothetical protein